MARINNLTNFLTDVSNAIKQKLGNDALIPASQFDTKISEIITEGSYQTKTITLSANGTTTITPDTGYDAIDELSITVNVPTSTDTSDATATASDIAQYKTAYINGGKISGTAWDGRGNSSAQQRITLGRQKSIRYYENGTHDYGWLEFVDVPSTNSIINEYTDVVVERNRAAVADAIGLTADKIKKGVTILGITGTYEGSSWENVSSFTMDNVLSSDNQPPLVFVYEDENEVVSGSRIRIMNISSTDTLRVEFEGDESYDERVLPGTTSINMFDANTQSSDMTPTYLSTVATFTWISPSL